MEKKKCFCSCLFDMSFKEFLTIRIIKTLYMVGIGIAGLSAICLVTQAFQNSFGMGLLYVIAAPIVFVLMVIVIRVVLELVLTFFRIEENTRAKEIAEPNAVSAPEPEAQEEDI